MYILLIFSIVALSAQSRIAPSLIVISSMKGCIVIAKGFNMFASCVNPKVNLRIS